jgi:hypothetical protein
MRSSQIVCRRPGTAHDPVCALALQRQAAYWGAIARVSRRQRSSTPLESQLESPPELPPEAPAEPILTLPGALTAYIALLAVIQAVRMLLPLDIDDIVIQMFGFIPKRYDSTLLAMPFPGVPEPPSDANRLLGWLDGLPKPGFNKPWSQLGKKTSTRWLARRLPLRPASMRRSWLSLSRLPR